MIIAGSHGPPPVRTVTVSTGYTTSASTRLDTSFGAQYTMAPEDDLGSGVDDDEGSETRRVADVVFGVVLGSIAIIMCLAHCIWRLRREQPGAANAPTAADVDEVIKTEIRAELPAERSALDVSNLDEFAARYS